MDAIKPIQLAKKLGVAPQYIYNEIRRGALTAYDQINGIDVPKYLLVEDVQAWLTKRAERLSQQAGTVQNLLDGLNK